MKSVTKTFLSDSGHGWLSVKKQELYDLGISHKISSYSYEKGKSVYLEEDGDAGVYLDVQRRMGVRVIIKEGKRHQRSPVRGYNSYTV